MGSKGFCFPSNHLYFHLFSPWIFPQHSVPVQPYPHVTLLYARTKWWTFGIEFLSFSSCRLGSLVFQLRRNTPPVFLWEMKSAPTFHTGDHESILFPVATRLLLCPYSPVQKCIYSGLKFSNHFSESSILTPPLLKTGMIIYVTWPSTLSAKKSTYLTQPYIILPW
jgi:hypothetical protein